MRSARFKVTGSLAPCGAGVRLGARALKTFGPVLCGVSLVFPPAAAAAAPGAQSPASFQADARVSDCRLALQARQLLMEDEALAPLSLGVSVRAGVAIVWGTAPSADLARKAEERLRQMPALAGVQNQVRVDPKGDPILDLHNQIYYLRQQTSMTSTVRPDAPSETATLTGRPGGPETAPTPTESTGPKPGIVLLAPIAVPSSPAAGPRETGGAIQSPPASGLPTSSLMASIDRLRQQNPRFRQVQPQLSGGVVRLHGSVAGWDDLFELARSISHLPGVERVILEGVHVTGR